MIDLISKEPDKIVFRIVRPGFHSTLQRIKNIPRRDRSFDGDKWTVTNPQKYKHIIEVREVLCQTTLPI